MGTRGHLGGLAEATLQALIVLDAAGKELVFVETVGAGQSEVEVIGTADTVVLVLMPGTGDSVQALKAGIMEIPDVIASRVERAPRGTPLEETRRRGLRGRLGPGEGTSGARRRGRSGAAAPARRGAEAGARSAVGGPGDNGEGLRVNVLSVEHHREGKDIQISATEVELTLVTRDSLHCDEVERMLEGWGYKVERVS